MVTMVTKVMYIRLLFVVTRVTIYGYYGNVYKMVVSGNYSDYL